MQRQPFKRITAKTALTLIQFSQNLVQGLWIDDSELLQLPNLDYDKVQAYKKRTGGKVLTIEQYCRKTKEERREVSLYQDEKAFEDAEKAIPCFPVIDVKAEYSVDGEELVAVGDILTIKITITHVNLQENESLGFVHSNRFPYLKASQWYLIFTDQEENELVAMDKLFIKERVHVKELKERMTTEGALSITLLLRNDSYRGFDKKVELKIPVQKEVKREIPEYNEEDVEATKAPNLLEAAFDMTQQADSDDEEEESEDEKAKPSQKPASVETKKEK
ncbi:hypothetical protein FGO68_gene1853 [Halteria grandinella]|uniref:SEC63 domain-containing protein n=1 Tax=Halteria grandinella TaxID=5974 RepID=A0A8J8ND02_HALGN|nr:hypothetical protein FGO68_gene1853 [Halteria grandinella]